MKIAIVGSEEQYWNIVQLNKAMSLISRLLKVKDAKLVSGHCHKGGIDMWAENIADNLKVPKEIYEPRVHKWQPNPNTDGTSYGYRQRNIDIARACDVLYCIEPEIADNNYRESGGHWTMCKAIELGKPAFLLHINMKGVITVI